MHIAIAAAELDERDIMAGDFYSNYLETHTQEKMCFISGPEFGQLEGYLLVIVSAFYGLRTAGAQWHDLYADVMHIMQGRSSSVDERLQYTLCMSLYTLIIICLLARNLKSYLIL
jgi:hypothetical protein